jgi:hypothetical protein
MPMWIARCRAVGASSWASLWRAAARLTFESVDFTEPALVMGFGDAVDEVVMDLDQSGPLSGVGS